MNRIELIQEVLGVSKARALINNNLMKDIKDDELIDFLSFRAWKANPKMSVETITKIAVIEYRRKAVEERLKAGNILFKTMEQLKEFLITYYKGENICNCGKGSGFFSCVVIAIDEKENFINKFAKTDYDTYLKLTIDEETRFLKWLLENQYKIGDINYNEILEGKKAIENLDEIEIKKDNYKEKEITDERVKNLLGNLTKSKVGEKR